MKILVLAIMTFGLTSVHASDMSPKLGKAWGYGHSYCTSNDSRFACEDRACDEAQRNAEAEAAYQCSSFGGVNATSFNGESYTVDQNTSIGICHYGLRYECLH